MKQFVRGIFIIFCATVFSVAHADRDIAGSSDHPLVSRYPQSNIITYEQKDYDEYLLPLGKPKENVRPTQFEQEKNLQGKITRIGYAIKPGTSTLKIYSNFETAVKKSGFNILFSCAKQDCGKQGSPWQAFFVKSQIWGKPDSHRMFSAYKKINGQDVYMVVYVGEQGPRIGIGVDVIEIKQMQKDLISIDENSLQQMLEHDGKAALYGIQFETDMDTLLPTSEQTIKVIANVLTRNKSMRIYIVGHTDDTGSNEHNMQLSNQRAQAVIKALVQQYKIDAARLTPFGAGPYAPLGNNADETGRALNRRVEIIKRL
jgi:outer membrane protein OmpA-like peptidoglycan-associated protein